jgi:hypothetical protein
VTLPRILAAMLATLALLAPTAMARPTDGPVDMHQSTAEAAARERAAQQKQDLRMPDTRDAAKQHNRTEPTWKSWAEANKPKLAAPTWPAYPSPSAPALPKLAAPTWPANPAPLTPTRTTVVETGDDGVDWGTIGIGVALSVLAVGAITGVSRRGGPRRRERFVG